MKAEERKRLQKNALADRLSRMWGALRSGSRTTYIYLGLILLIVVGYFAWSWYASTTAETESGLWTQLESVTDPDKLTEIAEENPDTLQGAIARQQAARRLLGPEGIERLGSTDDQRRQEGSDAEPKSNREIAIGNIEKARQHFLVLIEQLEDQPVLLAEAYLGAAQAEEALVGIPKPGDNNFMEGDERVWRGSLDQAAEYYRAAAKVAGGTKLGKQAAERAQTIEDKYEEIERFYVELNDHMTE